MSIASPADEPAEPVLGGQGVRVVRAENPAPGHEHLPKHRLRVRVATLQAKHPGEAVPSRQVVRMVLAEQLPSIPQDLIAQLLGVGIAALQPDYPG